MAARHASCASSHQMRGLHSHALPIFAGGLSMRAWACRCSCASPTSALPLLQLTACTCPTSPWPTRTESLGHNCCDGRILQSNLWKLSDSTSDKLSNASAKFFSVSFAPRVEGAFPPAKPSSSIHPCACLACGFHQKAPSANHNVLRRNLPLCLLQFGPVLPSGFVRHFSTKFFSESKPC